MAKVMIYSTPTCVYCKMAKEFFAKNNVAYEEHDVASDLKAREEMVSKSHQLGVPVIDIDGNDHRRVRPEDVRGFVGAEEVA